MYDLTELDGLDYLSYPEGSIKEAQALAAAAWGSQATWFLVNGSTVGIHVAVMATCSSNGSQDALILARNCHLSAYNAAALAGCSVVFAATCIAPGSGIACHVTPSALEDAICEAISGGLRPKAAMVVSPTYFGILSDIGGLAEVCKRYGMVLIVDEAHGAHLRFLDAYLQDSSSSSQEHQSDRTSSSRDGCLQSVLQAGADIVIQSTHKQLGALTQGAMLHLGNKITGRGDDSVASIDPARISRLLQVLQTSSPSYLVLASLDGARAQAQDASTIRAAHAAATRINTWFVDTMNNDDNHEGGSGKRGVSLLTLQSPDLRNVSSNNTPITTVRTRAPPPPPPPPIGRDPWRFTVLLDIDMCHLTGWDAAAVLEKERGVVAELATQSAIVFAAGIGTSLAHADALISGLEWLIQHHCNVEKRKRKVGDRKNREDLLDGGAPSYGIGFSDMPMALTPKEALVAKVEAVPVERAVGRIAAELLCPYPPGIPAVYPGEMVCEGLVDGLMDVMRGGGKVVGAADATLRTILVVSEDERWDVNQP